MHKGMDWYKRKPVLWLGGVQGMTARQIAVYDIVVELIYLHGGPINNDPSWIAGWISDMGPATVRRAIAELEKAGKLIVSEDEISQKAAENLLKTGRKLRENRQKTGKKGGENSGKSRRAKKKNKDLAEATASNKNEQDERREDNIPPLPPKQGGDLFGDDQQGEVKETPLSVLCKHVPEANARDFIEHRKAIKKALTVRSAQLVANKLAECSDPVGAINAAIERGWTSVFPESGQNQGGFRQPPQRDNSGYSGVTRHLMRMREQERTRGAG